MVLLINHLRHRNTNESETQEGYAPGFSRLCGCSARRALAVLSCRHPLGGPPIIGGQRWIDSVVSQSNDRSLQDLDHSPIHCSS